MHLPNAAHAYRENGDAVSMGERVETARSVYYFLEITEDGRIVVVDANDKCRVLMPASLGLTLQPPPR